MPKCSFRRELRRAPTALMMDLNADATVASILATYVGTTILLMQDVNNNFDKLNHKLDEMLRESNMRRDSDKKFDEMRRDSDKKFDGVNHKLDEMRRESDKKLDKFRNEVKLNFEEIRRGGKELRGSQPEA